MSGLVGDSEKADCLLGSINDLMGAALADGEAHHLTFIEIAPAIRSAQARASGENNQKLLLGQVVVVRIGGFAGRKFPETRADSHGADLATYTGAFTVEAGVLARFVELWAIDVGHEELLFLGFQPSSPIEASRR
jgi:hypothetical protein